MFEQEYRELSFVTRWNTIRRIRAQNVAEHMYYVALYTDQLLQILPWMENFESHHVDINTLSLICHRWAIYHDIPEWSSGDQPGLVKHVITDKYRAALFDEHMSSSRFTHDMDPTRGLKFPYGNSYDYLEMAKLIVKIADWIDSVQFLYVELSLGNSMVGHWASNGTVINYCIGQLTALWDKIPLPGQVLASLWEAHIVPIIRPANCIPRYFLGEHISGL